MTISERTEVGTCEMGNVFIFARTSSAGPTWMVRAGNHTIATVDSEARAEEIARTLCGDQNLNNDFIAEAPVGPARVKDVIAETPKPKGVR